MSQGAVNPSCLHRNIQISALFSVHTQLAAHILSSYWYPEWTLGPSGDKGKRQKTNILKKLAQAWGKKNLKRQHFMVLCWVFAVHEQCEQILYQPGHAEFSPLVLLWMISYHIKKKCWEEGESISFGRDWLSLERNITLSGCLAATS